jgi:NADH:ubiquinone oxidoreductase subunit 3 (subunit A)
MNTSRTLQNIETPRELARARRKKWKKAITGSVLCVGLCVGLNVVSGVLFGDEPTLARFWTYVALIPLCGAGVWLCYMFITTPLFRRECARLQQELNQKAPDVVGDHIRMRYESSAHDVERLRKKKHKLANQFVRALLWMLAFFCAAVMLYFWPKSMDMSSQYRTLMSLAPWLSGVLGLVRFADVWKYGDEWLDSRVEIREQLELRQDLAAVRREIHGVSGALSTAEHFDRAGDLSMSRDHEMGDET